MNSAPPHPLETIKAKLQEPETQAAFLAWFQGKYPTRKAEPFLTAPTLGLWQAFCNSPQGQAIAAEPPAVVPVVAPRSPITPLLLEPPAVKPGPTNGHTPTQAALFDLLAQGLQEVGFKPHVDIPPDSIKMLAISAAKAEVQRLLDAGTLHHTLEVKINDAPPVSLDEQVPAWFPRALKLAAARQHVLLIGPAGAGKSHGAKLIAKALNLPYTPMSLSGGTDEGVLVGWLLPLGEAGRFVYVPSAFVRAYEHGGVVVLEELDGADANVLFLLHNALANGEMPLPLRHEQPIATRHPDFVCLACANTHGHGADRVYVGRNQLDGATLSRFRMGQINVDYDEALEKALYLEPVCVYGHRLRARCRAIAGWTRDVSTRDIAAASHLLAAGVFDPSEAFYQYFADWSASDLRKVDVELNHTTGTAVLR